MICLHTDIEINLLTFEPLCKLVDPRGHTLIIK